MVRSSGAAVVNIVACNPGEEVQSKAPDMSEVLVFERIKSVVVVLIAQVELSGS